MRGKNLAKKRAKKLLFRLGFNIKDVDIKKKKDCSINVEQIANKLGIKVVLYPFSANVSGAFFKEDDHLVLGVNRKHHKHRRRFTLAHEIGHYILHSTEILHYDAQQLQLDEVFFRADNISNLDEIEANHFAAELLMPEELVYNCIQSGIRSIQELAECFNVSEDAMRYRLTNLGLL